MEKIKTLIVDDSVVYRTQIKAALHHFPWIEVVGAASNGKLALERLQQTKVDLLILDLEMPEMDGLQMLAEMNRLGKQVSTLVFSSASKRGAEVTFEALRLGAKDFATKPGSTDFGGDPAEKIRTSFEAQLNALFPAHRFGAAVSAPIPKPSTVSLTYPKTIWEVFKPKIVVIGSSTGGPTALEKIFSELSQPLTVPVLIAQHMPPIFTASLAERLTRLSGIPAKEGTHGEIVKPGHIYIAPGDFHMTVEGTPSELKIKLDQSPQVNSVRPAVDPLFASVSKIYKDKALGIILTGMGQDGKTGCEDLKNSGGTVIIQEKNSCVVFGMPGAVFESGAYDKMATPSEIVQLLREKIADPTQINFTRTAGGNKS